LITLMSKRRFAPKREYPCAWRPAIRGPASKLVARRRSGAKTRSRSSVSSGLPLAASTISPSRM
jgi:hypothetical protein